MRQHATITELRDQCIDTHADIEHPQQSLRTLRISLLCQHRHADENPEPASGPASLSVIGPLITAS